MTNIVNIAENSAKNSELLFDGNNWNKLIEKGINHGFTLGFKLHIILAKISVFCGRLDPFS